MIAWLWAFPVVRISVAVIVLTGLAFLFVHCIERKIRIWGMALQLLGAITVIVSLWGTQSTFKDLLPLKRLRRSWRERPRFAPQSRVLSAAGMSIGLVGGSARGRVDLSRDATLGDRVKMLEQKYNSLFDEVGTIDARLVAAVRKFSQDLQSEQRERERGDQSTQDQLKQAVAEGLIVQLFGAALLILGIISATASPELALHFGFPGACSEPVGSPEWSIGAIKP
jgi:hypothetical protein